MSIGITVDLYKTDVDYRTLYPYQEDATRKLDEYFNLDCPTKEQNGLLVMPTGSGKTFTTVNWLINSAIAQGYQVIWFAHRLDLLEQAEKTFIHRAPILLESGSNIDKLNIMPISGAHYKMSQASKCDVYICSIQSASTKNGIRFLKNMMGKKGREKLVVVIDEAHHAVMPSFQKLLNTITDLNPRRIFLGITATPTRMQEVEQKRLYKMFDCFKDVERAKKYKENPKFIYEVKLKDLIANKTLANPCYIRVETKIKDNVKFDISEADEKYYQVYGELSAYIMDQLAKSSYRNKVIVDEYIKNRKKYGKTLIFAINKQHAITLNEEFKKAFKENNLDLECNYCISGDADNQKKIDDFKAGKYEVFINVQILTEGSDVPDIQTVFLTRQTNSETTLMQMIGRGLRGVNSGGTETLNIVDFYDTWEKFQFWLDPEHVIDGMKGNAERKKRQSGEMVKIPVELILDIYSKMSINAEGKFGISVIPVGWYSVLNEEGDRYRVLVFDNQLIPYQNLENNISKIGDNTNAMDVMKKYFISQESLPKISDLEMIVDYIKQNEEMPEYFEFTELSELDNIKIVEEIYNNNIHPGKIKSYLKDKYESSPVFEDVYQDFGRFNNLIYATMAQYDEKRPDKIEYIDEKEEYKIIDDYFDLDKLLQEVIEYVKNKGVFEPNNMVTISYTDRPVNKFFGRCLDYEDGSYHIYINKLLSSPMVSEDIMKFLIYHELMHASGFWKHDAKFRKIEWKYENSDLYDSFLDRLMIDYDIQSALNDLDEDTRKLCSGNKISTKCSKKLVPISEDYAYEIKHVMAYTNIDKKIELSFEDINTKIEIANRSSIITSDYLHDYRGKKKSYTFSLLNNTDYTRYVIENYGSIEIDGNKDVLIFGFENSKRDSRFDGLNMHVFSNKNYEMNSLATIDISSAVEDDDYIYLIKNVANVVGENVIYELNKGAKNAAEKHARRELLIKKLNPEIINYNGKKNIIVCKFLKRDLFDKEKVKDIVYNLLNNFLRYIFSIEEIIVK